MNSTSNNNSSLALKRLIRDLKEVEKEPIPGISICMPDSTKPFTLHANIEIKDGIYEGIILHLLIHIPPDFPARPPAVNIAPGLEFGHKYHEHIWDNIDSGNSICTDLTSNFSGYFETIDSNGKHVKSGWTPAYTLSSVLMQLQVFFAEPDLPQHLIPTQHDIEKLKFHIQKFEMDIQIKDEVTCTTVTHSFESPYPPLLSEQNSPSSNVIKNTTKNYRQKESREELDAETASTSMSLTPCDEELSVVDAIQSSPEKIKELQLEVQGSKNEPTKIEIKSLNSEWIQPLKKGSKSDKKIRLNTLIVKSASKLQINKCNATQRPLNTTLLNKNQKPIFHVENKSKFHKSWRFQNEERKNLNKNQEESKEQNIIDSKHVNEINLNLVQNTIFKEKDIYSKISCQETPQQIKVEISNKLICSVSKADIFDDSKPIFGYPIDLEKDKFGRYWPVPVMEVLSYDAFVHNIQQNYEKLDSYHTVKFVSSFGARYNYWVPIYINEEHFERSKFHILNSISVICTGIEGKKENDFQPEMVLKVLPPILVKTLIHILKGTIHQSIAAIEAFCQFYQLLAKLIEIFPELKKKIDKEIDNFCFSEENRHKRVSGDLGEFVIKLALSSYGINNSKVKNLVLKEHLTRQVSWCIKADKGLGFQNRCPDFIKRFMNASQVSNQFLMVQFETAQLLLNTDIKKQLEKRHGFLNKEQMVLFRNRLEWIKNNVVDDWKMYVIGFSQEEKISNESEMKNYILEAFDMSYKKQYF